MKIQSLDFTVLEYPFHGYFKFIGPRSVRAAILVKMTAEDGTVGWGQSLPVPTWSFETVAAALAVMREHFAPAILGLDAGDLPGVQKALDRALAASFSTPMPITRAGIDLALHDLYGKLTGQSLCQMWGRPPGEPVQLSWTVNVLSLDDLGAAIENGRKRGYRNFNIKIGGGDPKFDVELARQVRSLAPESFLWADGNCGFDVATALEVAPQLAAVGVDVLESPLPANQISGYQALRRQGAVPIVMDEGVVSPVDAEQFIRLGMMDGLAIKISRAGGLESARQQIGRALDAGLFWLGSGLTDPDLSLAGSLALFAAYGLEKPAALNGPQFQPDSILATPLSFCGDLALLPSGPGLGVEVDETKIAPLLART
jgi:L-alanine-DL-glutamate epimerase-like enolase superfamily enzyme